MKTFSKDVQACYFIIRKQTDLPMPLGHIAHYFELN